MNELSGSGGLILDPSGKAPREACDQQHSSLSISLSHLTTLDRLCFAHGRAGVFVWRRHARQPVSTTRMDVPRSQDRGKEEPVTDNVQSVLEAVYDIAHSVDAHQNVFLLVVRPSSQESVDG